MKRNHIAIAALLICAIIVNVWVIRTYLLYSETTVEMTIKRAIVYQDTTTFVVVDEDGHGGVYVKNKALECARESLNETIPVQIRTFLDDRVEYVVDIANLKGCVK